MDFEQFQQQKRIPCGNLFRRSKSVGREPTNYTKIESSKLQLDGKNPNGQYIEPMKNTPEGVRSPDSGGNINKSGAQKRQHITFNTDSEDRSTNLTKRLCRLKSPDPVESSSPSIHQRNFNSHQSQNNYTNNRGGYHQRPVYNRLGPTPYSPYNDQRQTEGASTSGTTRQERTKAQDRLQRILNSTGKPEQQNRQHLPSPHFNNPAQITQINNFQSSRDDNSRNAQYKNRNSFNNTQYDDTFKNPQSPQLNNSRTSQFNDSQTSLLNDSQKSQSNNDSDSQSSSSSISRGMSVDSSSPSIRLSNDKVNSLATEEEERMDWEDISTTVILEKVSNLS